MIATYYRSTAWNMRHRFCFGVAAGTEPRDARQGGAFGAQWKLQCQNAAKRDGMMGTYRFIHTPTLHFTWQVIRPDGLPDIALTFAANEWLRSLSASTVPVYLRELIAFLRWASTDRVVQANGWTLQGNPAEVRNLVREYLCSGAQCKVIARPDRNGLRVLHVRTTDQTHINVRIFLSALKRLFDTLGGAGMYAFPNPLRHEDAERIAQQLRDDQRAAIQAVLRRGPMPAVSGVDAPPVSIRLSENYFRFAQSEWIPKSIDDPDFPNAVYSAGRTYGWKLRELCVARALFESGGRISEILDLTAKDWAVSDFTHRFAARNKGSHGERVKTLVVAKPTATLFRKYFDDDQDGRAAWARDAVRVRDLEKLLRSEPDRLAQIRLFVSKQGTPFTAKLFRDDYWRPALRSAGIDADPHQGRHWFVTNALHLIERSAEGEADLERRKQELIQYMSWASGERTLAAYAHVRRDEHFMETMAVLHREMQQRERRFSVEKHGTGNVPKTPEPEPHRSRDLLFLLGEET